MTAERELRFGALLERRRTKLVEPAGVVARLAAPERERGVERLDGILRVAAREVLASRAEQALEAREVELVLVEHEHVTAARRLDAVPAERLP